MRHADNHHLTDQDLLLAIEDELPVNEAECVRTHLAGCWTCRTRMREIEGTIADFIRARESGMPQLPPAEGPRALLKARLAQLVPTTGIWQRFYAGILPRRVAAATLGAGLAALLIIVALRSHPNSDAIPNLFRARDVSIPDPRITPGAVLPLTRNDVCAADSVEALRVVPADVARQVFAAYGIQRPEPRAYEVDYLITPALGGSDNIRNFWPQPYRNTIWNAHVKDALEAHLRQLVCQGDVDLATAQQEIAQDWIAAYKRYFQTDTPLTQHATFLKDLPWE